MRKLFIFLIFLIIFLVFPSVSFAQSSYVLPYPSTMPGSIFYKLHLVLEKGMQYWYFGNFGQFDYNLKESDKYLVEAKTLFEYNQYLLGYNALQKSDTYFKKIKPFLFASQNEGKNISEKNNILTQAANKHIEVLERIKLEVPSSFTWVPEKTTPTNLNLFNAINNSKLIRKEGL